MSFLYPTPEEISAAIAWAVKERQERIRLRPDGLLLSAAALEERVSGYPTKPEPHGIGWWIVGVLVDTTDQECNEYSIITVPGASMLRTRPRYEAVQREPPKPSRWYFSGATKRWEINPNVADDDDLTDFIPDGTGDSDPHDFRGSGR